VPTSPPARRIVATAPAPPDDHNDRDEHECGDRHVHVGDTPAAILKSVNTRVVAVTFMALACVGMLPAQAQRVSIDALRPTDKTFVQATGEGTISARPDQAVVEIGVVSQGATAAAAAAQNAKVRCMAGARAHSPHTPDRILTSDNSVY
jgi:hypothetical protein